MNQSEDQRLISLATSAGFQVLAGSDHRGTFYAHLTTDDGVGLCVSRQTTLVSAVRHALLGCFARGLVDQPITSDVG
jgi:hypothetical protein